MMYADPWDESLRLESLLERELLVSSKGSRLPADAFGSAEPPRPSPASISRHDRRMNGHSTLGFMYAGHPYKIDHV